MRDYLKNCIQIIGIILVFVIIVLFAGTYVCNQRETQYAVHESKNIELSLRLLAIDYYAQDKRIYDPLRPDGLIGGAAEQVRDLSGAEGELILTSWDANRQAARSFTYRTGKLIVFYNYDEQQEEHWSLYYRFRDLVKTD